MKQAFTLAAIAAVVVDAAPGRRRGKKRQGWQEDSKFLAFASRFNKNMSKTDEFTLRQEIYHKCDEKINEQNAKSMLGDMNAVKYAHNQFSDLTQEEFESTAMGLNP